jgi:hypothetical protein
MADGSRNGHRLEIRRSEPSNQTVKGMVMKAFFRSAALAGSLALGVSILPPALAAQTIPGGAISPAAERGVIGAVEERRAAPTIPGGAITPAPDRGVIDAAEERRPARPAAGSADACKRGYVWRKAGPGDRVCVAKESAARVAQENSTRKKRVQPGVGAYGPNTCRSGFVWREAFPGDGVCVTPRIRALVAQENRVGPSLRVR